MTLNLIPPTISHTDFTPRITVIGVGGGGTNAVNNMIALNLQGVEFVVANTDAQQLTHSKADRRIQLGPHLTEGLGAGAKPEIGRAAAEEAADELDRHLSGSHMVFITAGMGRTRIVLTGGACQLPGLREMAARTLGRQVRLGRPATIRGLPELASGPAFAVAAGLLAWSAGEGRTFHDVDLDPPEQPGWFRWVVNFLKDRV